VDTDSRIAATLVALYFILALALLPPTAYVHSVGGGILVFGTIFGIMQRVGRGPLPGLRVLFVGFTSGIVLALPTFPAMGGTNRAAVPIGFFGVQVAIVLFGVLRSPLRPRSTDHVPLRRALKIGAFAALGLSIIAMIPMALGFETLGRSAFPILLVYPGYFVGFLSAATAYWALQRVNHLATGRYLIGLIGGTCVYAAVAPVVALTERDPLDIGVMLALAVVAGGFVGPAYTLNTVADLHTL
jgi:hypothetical protein